MSAEVDQKKILVSERQIKDALRVGMFVMAELPPQIDPRPVRVTDASGRLVKSIYGWREPVRVWEAKTEGEALKQL